MYVVRALPYTRVRTCLMKDVSDCVYSGAVRDLRSGGVLPAMMTSLALPDLICFSVDL